MVLGHEASGTIIEVGAGVSHLHVGDRVCMEPGVPNPASKAGKLGLQSLASAAQPTVLYVPAAEQARLIPLMQAAAGGNKTLPEDQRATPSWGPFQGHMGYRTSPQPLIYTNDDFAEYYSIVEGEGTMILGGTLVNAKRTGPHAESATVQGAKEYRLAKGDLLMVPRGVPHGISQVRGKLVYISMHLALNHE